VGGQGDDEQDPRMRPTEAAPPLVRLPARPWVGGDTTAELEAPTAPLPIALDRERTPASPDRERLTMSVAPPANAPFGPPIRVDAPTPRPRAPSQTSRRPLSREPSRPPRNNTQVRPVRDYPVARGLLRNPDASVIDERPLSAAVPRAFVRSGVPAEPRSSARAEADGMLQEMAEGLLVGGDGAGNSEIRVTLGEEFFGGTELHIQHTPEGLIAILRPPDRETYRVLASELPRLRVQLEERGLRVSNLRVEEP